MDLTSFPLFTAPGTLELAVILLIAVLLFGANKIPKLARSTGQAMGEFQRGREEIEEELEEMRDGASLESSDKGPTTEPSTEPASEPVTETENENDESKEPSN